MCPPEGLVFPGNNHCYQLVVEKAEWLEAQRHCQELGNGDLAFVSSPDIQSFLVAHVISPTCSGERTGGVLLNAENFFEGEAELGMEEAVRSVSEAVLADPWQAEEVLEFPELAFRHQGFLTALEFVTQELHQPVQVRFQVHRLMDGEGSEVWFCFFEEIKVQDPQPWGSGYTLKITEEKSLSMPEESVSRIHSLGAVVILEKITEEKSLSMPEENYQEENNATEPFPSAQDDGNWTLLECPPGLQWCPLTSLCSSHSSCCNGTECANSSFGSSSASGALQPSHSQPSRELLKEFLFTVPAGPSSQYQVSFSKENIFVRAGDVFSIQHDAASGSLLRCGRRAPSLGGGNCSSWAAGSCPSPAGAARADGSACSLRVRYAEEQLAPVLSPHNAGLERPGAYAVRASVGNGLFSANLSCGFRVASRVSGLRVIHPAPQGSRVYLPTNHTTLLLKLSSGVNATASCLGDNRSVPFVAACPPAVAALCARETNDTWFAVLQLGGLGEGLSTHVLLAENSVSSQNITVTVKVEEPIRGLRAMPDPESRVLLNTRVSYIPVMEAGSDVTFRWTVDDKPSFTFYNVVFNVIYQSPAVYKLSPSKAPLRGQQGDPNPILCPSQLTASNHVSNFTVNYNVTVEMMNKMRNLSVVGALPVVPQNSSVEFSARVHVDSAVEALFLWDFGDGVQETYLFKPPYNKSFLVPDPSVHEVVIEHNVSHVYQDPGEYALMVVVSNQYENLTHLSLVQVHSYLIDVKVEAEEDVLVVGQPVTFRAAPLPSPYGVVYTWDFGDGSSLLTDTQPSVTYSYSRRGVYNVTVTANNTVSSVETVECYQVFEEVTGLRVTAAEAAEQGAAVTINASVETGDSITWIFDMGDGTVLRSQVPVVEHVYIKDINCTVNVTAVNPVNSVSQAVPVRIFVLEILKIEPTSCILEHPDVQLTAYVTGNPEEYIFDWTFGDGSSNVTVSGDPVVVHNFTRSGTFPLTLTLSSSFNKANYFTSVCVEPEILNVTLLPSKRFVRLGEETSFQVSAVPPYQYRYRWDFGNNESSRSSGTEVTYTYKNTGVFLVTVTVSNNVSFNNDTAFVEVQEPVGVAKIEYNGTDVLELNQIYLFSASMNGTKVSYCWDFGDGTVQPGQVATHSYNSTGHYSITVTGQNDVSSNETTIDVAVKRRLFGLTVNASRTVVPLNGSVSFVATLVAGTAIRYSWILCDRCTPIQGSSTISYTFRSVGTFNVIVTAENKISSLQDSIYVYVLEQIEGLQVASTDLVEDMYFPTNKTLHLQAVVREGTNISYSWVVQRDGNAVQTFTGKTFPLSILEAGNYTVYLKATNMLGCATANRTLEFMESLGVLRPYAFPNPAAINASVNISATITSGTGVTYVWYLEDGSSPVTSEPFIIHSFQSSGMIEVTVGAENKLNSTNATVSVCVEEVIEGLTIGTAELDCRYVSSGSTVVFEGELQRGTEVTWLWQVPNGTLSGQSVAVTFPMAGLYTVHLNASNHISWALASRNISVLDRIQGLEVVASKKVVEPGEQVTFEIRMLSGTSVSYLVSISGDYSVVLNGSRYSHEFTKSGDYLVTVTVQNQISIAHAQVLISVLEPIQDLRLLNCCEEGIPTGTEKSFSACVGSGSRVSFSWQFCLWKERGRSVVAASGERVSYAPEAAGLLEIHLTAFNDLGSVNITRTMQVQDPIVQVSLSATNAFVNRTALFEAVVVPSSRSVEFLWSFGDGSSTQTTRVAVANYSYLSPGDYLVEVNATNLISFFIAQLTVTVKVLECEEPEVELALPPQVVMKRSQRNYLEAQIDLRGCIKYQTEHLWEIYRAPSCMNLDDSSRIRLPNVDVNRPQLVIPKLGLEVGSYCFVFIVSFGDTPLSKSIFANVTVIPSKLVPIIDGGSYRVWSNTQDLVLDGEKSYDPNLDDGEQTPLLYEWSCTSSSKSCSGRRVAKVQFPAQDDDPGTAVSAKEGIVTISKALLEADVEYTFDLTVSKEGMSPEATNQTVFIKRGGVPIVSLECVSCKAQSVYEVSKSSYVYLEGTCQNCHNDSKLGRWAAHSFKNKSLILDKTTTSTGDTGMNLVLRPGALRDGEGYTFTLHITDLTTGEEGFASIDLLPNQPPVGGSCRLSPEGPLRALVTKVHFECAGWRDTEDAEGPLVFILLASRHRPGHFHEFCVYKGSRAEHGAFLPPGFHESGFQVSVAVLVQDQLGATVVAVNRSMEIGLPEGFPSLSHWLYNQTDTVLQGLVKQGDPQQVIEYSLALITILNEYERSVLLEPEAGQEFELRTWTRNNITETLNALKVNTVDDIQQISAALAQCTVVSKELVCKSCLTRTLNKLETMMTILQGETTQGTVTPTGIADNILNITALGYEQSSGGGHVQRDSEKTARKTLSDCFGKVSGVLLTVAVIQAIYHFLFLSLLAGDLIHLVNTVSQESKPQELLADSHNLLLAPKAYNLSSSLMRILMKSRVLNEEPLELVGGEIKATGKRSDPFNLLCYENTPNCQFSIPQAFNSTLSNLTDVIQVMFQVDSNPFPFGYISNYTVSTKVASMEFQTHNGVQIPIGSLDSEKAITVMVSNSTEPENLVAGTEVIEARTSVNLIVIMESNNREAGLHFQLTYRVLNEHYLASEPEPFIMAYLHHEPEPNEHNCSASKRISLDALAGSDHKLYTFFTSPRTDDPIQKYYLNITNHFSWSAVEVTLGLYTSLCQYFSEQEKRWKTEGIVPLEETRPDQAVCLTQHLTAFGASLFVPPNSVQFIFPAPGPGLNYIVLLTCAVCFVTYSVAALIVHKLDVIDTNRVGVIPFCGKNGMYKYEILVKTGWGRGSGTTAHVGIALYGVDNKSGHRHLDGDNAFHRNSLDVFQIATERSLGSVWRIRIWHDNKGLSPSWYLQHVIVRDLQSSKSYFFLVNDWLSVESEDNDGLSELRSSWRIFVAELQRGFFEKHVWLSLWDRPPRSRFTRVQRATCCCLLIFLFLCANAVWYGVVGSVHLRCVFGVVGSVHLRCVFGVVGSVHLRCVMGNAQLRFVTGVVGNVHLRCVVGNVHLTCMIGVVDNVHLRCIKGSVHLRCVMGSVYLSNVAVSSLIPVSVDTVAVGLVSSVVVYPLYLVILFLFRMARGKVSISHTMTHSDQQSLEIDNYLDSSILDSSFPTFPGLQAEAFSEQTKTDLFLEDSKSLVPWPSSEALLSWPDLLSDPSIMDNTIQKLKRGRASRHLGLEAPLAAEEDTLSLGIHQGQPRYFSASDEDLIRQILADGASGISQDLGPYVRAETDLISGLSSVFGEKVETVMMQRLNDKGQSVAPPPREVSRSAKSTWTVADQTFRKRLLPPWCSLLAHGISLLLLATAAGVSVWIGVGFSSSVALMWLISGIFSFLASFLLWEPLKVLLEALYFSLVAKRLHPEEDDTLVEQPCVEHVSERISKVRPPQGFALFQAKEEARKVKLLHRMLKNFLIYMMFLLVVLLTNYGDASRTSRAFLLQSSIKQQLGSNDFLLIKRSDQFWVWMSQVFLPYLYNNGSGQESHSTTLGTARLRQLRLRAAECQQSAQDILQGMGSAQRSCTDQHSFATADYGVGWESTAGNGTAAWAHSAPDLAGIWYWGYISFYDSSGYVQELGPSLEQSRAQLEFLQQHTWIDNMSRAVFVELLQYNPSVDLHVALTLRLEFPGAGQAIAAVTVSPFPLLRLSGGVTLQLLMMVFLMLFVVYFVVSESLAIKKEGRAYFTLWGNYSQWVFILLTTCTVLVHLSQATLADQQWLRYLSNRRGFTNFYQVAFLSSVFSSLAASLLFLLTVQAAQQLRFVRQWSVFGKTFQKSVKELMAAGVAFALLLLAYAQLGFLLFSSSSESFRSVGSSLLLLLALLRGSASLRPCLPEASGLCCLFCTSYVVLEVWIVLRLLAAVLIHSYREMHFELYRPAFEPQDYEMVELFVRRLKMWMGFSKAKEFRHKVRFEGMEPLPSRDSSDSKSFRGATPSAASDSSRTSTSSSQLDGLSLVLSARDSLEVDADIQRLLSLFEMLLAQFDRVNQVTEDVSRIEHLLEFSRSRRARRRHRGPEGGSEQGPSPEAPDTESLSPRCAGAVPGGRGAVPGRLLRASRGVSAAAGTPGKPCAARRKRPLRAKNRVHPTVK
ncbi:Polycystin-1 [Lonchura striata]|uniref:Polycystin-1 n=1 Tax=Lonchura striata TaxID=40157 RepID=A0A218U952_9PASE|nr:Polycystin-1 [Lonchura striata domestica]